MSFFWWIFGSLFIFLIIYYSLVALDKHNTKRKLRNGAISRGTGNAVPAMNQQTVIYTIPTTRQLAQQYPGMVASSPTGPGYPHPQNYGNQSPPNYMDLPPTYDQVVVHPTAAGVPATNVQQRPPGAQQWATTTTMVQYQ